MKPKEKAIKLLDIFIQTNGNSFFAKECALIAVDELIADNDKNETIVNGGLNKTYWQQVKSEIEKL
jgi:hypothetical protein